MVPANHKRGQRPDPVPVLVQDYHLSLAPRLLRERLAGTGASGAEAAIAHFSHTPWAPPDYYRLLPGDIGQILIDGMLGADHIGFHADRWAAAFLDCCEALPGAEVTRAGPGTRADPDGPAPLGWDKRSAQA